MVITRRDTLVLSAGAVAVTAFPAVAIATDEEIPTVDEVISAFTNGAEITDGPVQIIAPEIAENGNTVPVEVSAEGASAILLVATGNPRPGISTFRFGPLSGSSKGSTRVRLAQTQDVIAVAQLSDGSFVSASTKVKVTIGGCGG